MRRWRATESDTKAEPEPRLAWFSECRACIVLGLCVVTLHVAAQTPSVAPAANDGAGQWSGSIAIDSDSRPRGVTLSDGDPSWRASLVFDGDGGWFAGASAATVQLKPGPSRAGLTTFFGVAGAPGDHMGWEAGLLGVFFEGAGERNYAEAFAGMSGERWNARASFSPDYYGYGQRTLYLELNGHQPMGERWRLVGHTGVLLSHGNEAPSPRWDLRLAAALTLGQFELQAGWVGSTLQPSAADPYPARRSAWVTSLAYFF